MRSRFWSACGAGGLALVLIGTTTDDACAQRGGGGRSGGGGRGAAVDRPQECRARVRLPAAACQRIPAGRPGRAPRPAARTRRPGSSRGRAPNPAARSRPRARRRAGSSRPRAPRPTARRSTRTSTGMLRARGSRSRQPAQRSQEPSRPYRLPPPRRRALSPRNSRPPPRRRRPRRQRRRVPTRQRCRPAESRTPNADRPGTQKPTAPTVPSTCSPPRHPAPERQPHQFGWCRACPRLPPGARHRRPSRIMPAPRSGPISRRRLPLIQANRGLRSCPMGSWASTARIAMTELAEKTLDLQYFIWLGSQRVGSPTTGAPVWAGRERRGRARLQQTDP